MRLIHRVGGTMIAASTCSMRKFQHVQDELVKPGDTKFYVEKNQDQLVDSFTSFFSINETLESTKRLWVMTVVTER